MIDRQPRSARAQHCDDRHGHPMQSQWLPLQGNLQGTGTSHAAAGTVGTAHRTGAGTGPARKPAKQPGEQRRGATHRDHDRQRQRTRDARRRLAPQHLTAPEQPQRQRLPHIEVIGADITEGPAVAAPLREHVARQQCHQCLPVDGTRQRGFQRQAIAIGLVQPGQRGQPLRRTDTTGENGHHAQLPQQAHALPLCQHDSSHGVDHAREDDEIGDLGQLKRTHPAGHTGQQDVAHPSRGPAPGPATARAAGSS